MAGHDLHVSPGDSKDLDGLRADQIRDIPWSGLALSGMGLIAVSLVAFVMVTEERSPPREALTTLEPIFSKRISVPDIAPAPVMARSDDATSTIGRTIRTAPAQTAVGGGFKVARSPLDAATSLAPAPDPRLIAPGPHGALPRIGRDGARPADVYARPLSPAPAAGAPRVAIVLTGLGFDAATSARAIEILPPAITLAFASYGENIEDQAEQARAAGHELLLQTPMEGFADGRSSVPRTLAATAPRERTLDSLHWHMSRFPGYIGLTNFSGARFMSTPQAFAPVMQDIADRGLVFLDDGASAPSLTFALAAVSGAEAARADVNIDMMQKPEAIDAALRQLEGLARERGAAIGVVSLQPQSIDRIGRFTQGLGARGVVLVPVSALMAALARTSAR